jgi:hypothetical protein
MGFPHRQALRAWLLPFRYIEGTSISSYSLRRLATFIAAGDGRNQSGLQATRTYLHGLPAPAGLRTQSKHAGAGTLGERQL